MKYKIVLNGEMEKVKEIMVEQTFKIKVSCTTCREESTNPMIVTSDSVVRKERGLFNFMCTCHVCGKQLCVNVNKPPKKQLCVLDAATGKEADAEMFPATKEGNSYVVSELVLTGCELVYLEVLAMDIIDDNNFFYTEVPVNSKEKCWTGDYSNSFSSIVNYSFEFIRIK